MKLALLVGNRGFFPSTVIDAAREEMGKMGYSVTQIRNVGRMKHIFTHIRWDITCIWVQTESCAFDAYTLSEIEETISLPTAFKQCLTMIK